MSPVRAIWLVTLVIAIYQGISIPGSDLAQAFASEHFGTEIVWGVPFVFFGFAAFIQRRTIGDTSLPFAADAIDRRFGAGAYRRFIDELRPTLLLMSFMLVSGAVALALTYMYPPTDVYGALKISGLFLSGGLGLLAAYVLSIRFPPKLR